MFYYLIISTEFGNRFGHPCPSSGHCIVCLMAPKKIYMTSSSFKQCGFVTSNFFFLLKKVKDFTKGQIKFYDDNHMESLTSLSQVLTCPRSASKPFKSQSLLILRSNKKEANCLAETFEEVVLPNTLSRWNTMSKCRLCCKFLSILFWLIWCNIQSSWIIFHYFFFKTVNPASD